MLEGCVAARRRPVRMAAAPVRMSASARAGGERCHVFLERDTINPREYAARVLIMVCDVSEREAEAILAEAQASWMGRCGTWERAIAQHVCDGLFKAGLSAVITPVADGCEDDAAADESDPRPRYLDGTLIEEEGDLPGWYGRGMPGAGRGSWERSL